jgi:hypothetical protein
MSRTVRPLLRTATVVAALIVVGLTSPGLIFRTRLTAQVVDPCAAPVTNPVACENTQAGNPISEWDIVGSGNASIQGFATDISVNRGQTVRFKVDTPATAYQLDIYRLGYYGGAGARKIATVVPSALLPQSQPACAVDSPTGLVDCGVWNESASWAVPSTAVSGIYIAKLVRTDGTPGSSHMVFIVRDDAAKPDVVFQTSDSTWQAYNRYGGNSLYTGSPAGRAYKVSYNRPFTTRQYAPEDWLFNAEYPMVRFLEANGYNVAYMTGVDTDRRPTQLTAAATKPKILLSVGHDEYWSAAQRTNVEAARDAGVSLAFFSGNEVFWKSRWEPSIDGTATDYRTLVCYKDTHANAKIDPLPGMWTGTWRDARFSPPNDGGRPENNLTGTLFMVNSGTSAIEVPEPLGKFRLWRNTSVATLATGSVATLAAGSLGYEWDEAPSANAPAGLIRLSSTTRSGVEKLQDNGSTYASGTATHSLTLYRAASGALVFGAGSVQWSWGLDPVHDRDVSVADARMRQATVNLLADMGAQAMTLQAGLVAATASSDVSVPTSTITSPASGATLLIGAPVTITGTAADGGGLVAGVEVSTNNGTTWNAATGTTSWTFSWTPTTAGPTTILSRAIDDSGNIGASGTGVNVTVSNSLPSSCPCTLWPDTAVPAVVDAGADSPVNLGVKFRSDVDGFITGVRFYKSAANTGTHIGHLWTTGGSLLGSATFGSETASGWQTATFSAPIAVTANTLYVASYFVPGGHYSFNNAYFASTGQDRAVLHAPATTVSSNGVFAYGPAGSFPSATYNAGNYWVDVVFVTSTEDTTPPVVSSVSPSAGATVTDINTNVTATFSESMDASTISTSTFELRDGAAVVPATISYDAGTRTATLDPVSALTGGHSYTATIRGGSTDPTVRDLSGLALAADFVWSFTIAGDTTPPTVSSVFPAAGATDVITSTQVRAVFSEAMDAASVNGASFELRNSSNAVVTGAVSYDAATRTATLTPTTALANASTYTATVKGGGVDPRVKDAAGNALASSMTWSFATAAAAPSGCPCTLWAPTTTPAVVDGNDASAVELGVKFRSTIDGFVTGIRFYKSAANTGAHTGSLWSLDGTRLATANFTGETGSGWQQVNFNPAVAITANTTYVASYFAPAGHYSYNSSYFTVALTSGPLQGLATGTSPNGVYRYGAGGGFPTSSYNAANYWVDVVFNTTTGAPDTTPPSVATVSPASGASGVSVQTTVSATFSEGLDPTTVNTSTVELRDPSNALIAATVTWNAGTRTATLQPSTTLNYSTVYTAHVKGGATDPRVTDLAGNALASTFSWTITTGAPVPPSPTAGPGGPILVVTQASNPFSTYYAEILRNEGLNAFALADLSTVTSGTLAAYSLVILGEGALSASQVTMFSNWVSTGGNLIAMRPDKQLASLLGLVDAGTTLADGYLLIANAGAGTGLVNETIQYHGTADRYTLNGATAVAQLYSNATSTTANPAVTLRAVGGGGQVAAFAYDLAKSVVYTRQGNPAWQSTERDGQTPARSDDLFFPDYVDFSKIQIPQADEQMRLLANLILQMTLPQKPLPRFWYLPRGLKAAIVMTGDDHANGGTAGRFQNHKNVSPAGCSVENWECVRSTSYVYPGTTAAPTISNAQVAAFEADGFEVALHLTTNCQGYTPSSLNTSFDQQLAAYFQVVPSAGAPRTNRNHCVVWSDYTTGAEVELAKGIRLDTTYYYWPGTWILDRPGLFTGSGMAMRFAKTDGSMVDVYQGVTQLTDESSQTYPLHVNTLLDNAVGSKGYYGTFVANMHTDAVAHASSDAIIASAQARGVPVISAEQLLTWLDGRNGSSFGSISWLTGLPGAPQGGSTLSFTVNTAVGSTGLQAMLPNRLNGGIGVVTSITRDGAAWPFSINTLKGIEYAVFTAAAGNYVVTYDTTAPNTLFTATPPSATNATTATVQFSSTEGSSTFQCRLDGGAFGACTSPTVYSSLAAGSHTVEVRATDAAGNVDATPATYTWVVDLVAPTISSRTPAPGASNVAPTSAVTIVFSEAINAGTVTTSSVFVRRVGTGTNLAATVSSNAATVTLQPTAPLLLGASYEVTVASTVADVAGNQCGTASTWTFTANSAITDSTTAQFSAGTADSGAKVGEMADGEVLLASAVSAEFSGTTVPADFTTTTWQSGGTVTVAAGVINVNASRAGTAATFSAGRVLEFTATFTGEAFQHVGFGLTLAEMPFAIFSTNNGGGIYARTHNGSTGLATLVPGSAAMLNVPQRFRIEWNASSVDYYVNGSLVASHALAISTPMRPLISDFLTGGQVVKVDWLRLSPYASAGTFTSRVLDGGAPTNWGAMTWTADLPAGTSVVIRVRTGNTATPDVTWTPFTTVSGSAGSIGQSSRYIQYRLELSTSSPGQTPVIRDVTVNGVNQ